MRYEIVIEEPDPQTGTAERVVATTRRLNGAYNEFESYIDSAYQNMRKHAEEGGDVVYGGATPLFTGEIDGYEIVHCDSTGYVLRFRRISIREKRQ